MLSEHELTLGQVSRTPHLVLGKWRVVNAELITEGDINQPQVLVFGDPKWTDYTVDVEMSCARQPLAYGMVCRYNALNEYWLLSLGNYGPTNADLVCILADEDGWRSPSRRWRPNALHGRTGVWQKVQIIVRGERIIARVDGNEIATSSHPRVTSGAVGFHTFAEGEARWRNLRVTDSKGNVLWQGLPELGQLDFDPTAQATLPQFSEPPVIIDGELLGSATPGTKFEMRLGDYEWQDYDVHIEYLHTKDESCLQLRCNRDGGLRWDLSLGGWGPTNVDLRAVVPGEKWWESSTRRWCPDALSGKEDMWRSLDVRLRGTQITVRLESREIASSEHPLIAKGGIGMVFTDGRWRNLEVRDPDGKLLLEGWPKSLTLPTQSSAE